MAVETPEHDKQHAILEKSQAIGEFLEWLQTKGIELAVYPNDGGYEHLMPYRKSIQMILADYFNIDLGKIEAEKRAIIKELSEHPIKQELPSAGGD